MDGGSEGATEDQVQERWRSRLDEPRRSSQKVEEFGWMLEGRPEAGGWAGDGDQVEDVGWVSVRSRPEVGWTVSEVVALVAETSSRGLRMEDGSLVWTNRGQRTEQWVDTSWS